MARIPQIRIVLRMCGGTLLDAFTDSDKAEVRRIVITEDASHAEDKTREFFVSGGHCHGDFVYTEMGSPIVDKATVEAVINAADARSAAEDMEEPVG